MIKKVFNDFISKHCENPIEDADLKIFSEFLVAWKDKLPPLYRYSQADYNNIRGLETQTLYLSHVGDMNDIFEGLSCKIDDKVIDHIEEMQNIAYIKSFSESRDNLLMWAHYSKNYTGMCVEYDFSKLPDEILYHLFPIYYSQVRNINKKIDGLITEYKDLKRMNDDNCYPNDSGNIIDVMSMFLTKSECWSYEKEWRIIATYPQIHNSASDFEDENKKLYAIDSQVISVKSCIKAVYLGAKMKQSIKKHISEICREKLGGIPVYSTRLSEYKYELDYIKEGN